MFTNVTEMTATAGTNHVCAALTFFNPSLTTGTLSRMTVHPFAILPLFFKHSNHSFNVGSTVATFKERSFDLVTFEPTGHDQ